MDPLVNSSNSSTSSSFVERDHFSSIRKRNRRLIIGFFSLIILLALIIGAMITSLVRKNIIQLQSIQPNQAIRAFCSASRTDFACINTLSSTITPSSEADPNQILINTLEISISEVPNVISTFSGVKSESDFRNCSRLLRDSLSQLNRTLGIMRQHPDILTQTYKQRREMTVSISSAVGDLRSCSDNLRKVNSTAVKRRIHGLQVYVRYSRDFLFNCEVVLERFNFALQRMEYENSRNFLIVEDAAIFYGSQYLVLIFLFCLLLRIY